MEPIGGNIRLCPGYSLRQVQGPSLLSGSFLYPDPSSAAAASQDQALARTKAELTVEESGWRKPAVTGTQDSQLVMTGDIGKMVFSERQNVDIMMSVMHRFHKCS